jgi:hypothetical protein
MQPPTTGFEFQGLWCFAQRSEQHAYYVVPVDADLDRDGHGRPLFNLIVAGSTRYAMFTAVWRAVDTTLSALREEIARREEIADPSTIILSFAPVHTVKCDLLLGDGSGELQTIATSSTSGMPPYGALFNLNLTPEQFAGVAAAAHGRTGHLLIEYTAAVAVPISVRGRLIPLSDAFVPWLREYVSVGRAGFRAAIEEAIRDALATIHLDTPHPSGTLVADVYERVLTRATYLLPRLIEASREDATVSFEVAVEFNAEIDEICRPQLDLATVAFYRGHLDDTNALLPPARPERQHTTAETQSTRVALGFDAQGAPVSWIRLQWDNAEALLKPPDFAPVEIARVPASRMVRVTTSYSNGAPTYKKDIVLSQEPEVHVAPQDLGLIQIMVDARPLRDAGARSAQVWLHYRVRHRRDDMRHSIQFHGSHWLSPWWLTVPTESALAHLHYRWTAVTHDGHTVNQSAEHAGTAAITLSFAGGTTDATD